jgi:hypothetical protein
MPDTIAEFRKEMSRRFVVAVLVIAVSGLLPLAANHGSCHSMPCCHKTKSTISATAGCCEPATCVKEQQVLRAGATTSTHAIKFIQAHIVDFIGVAPPTATAPLSESPPSRTAERLSVLSVLLI